MSLAKRLWEARQPQKKRTTARKTGNGAAAVSVESEDVLGNVTPVVENLVLSAMREAGNMLRDEARANLVPHQSKNTGTAALWSKRTEQYHRGLRKPLIDSLEVHAYFGDSGQPVVEVKPDENNGWIARFLEFSRSMWFWGTDGGETSIPIPFMRDAYDARGQEAITIITDAMRKEMR